MFTFYGQSTSDLDYYCYFIHILSSIEKKKQFKT